MTKEEAIARIEEHKIIHKMNEPRAILISEALDMAIKALEQEPCEDAISRQAVNILVDELARAISDERCYMSRGRSTSSIMQDILDLSSVNPKPKTGHCKDCKWWKDSDGVYRRGVRAESKCPINNVSVNHGLGYCYMFEPQESEVNNG